MARRRGRLGDSLAVDDYSGRVVFRSQLRKDHDGFYSTKPLARNLQEIASPLNDPRPVKQIGAAPNYETYNLCDIGLAPLYVGVTSVRFNNSSAAMQSDELDLNPGVGDGEIGCNFRVY